jgi:hypothetical protein
MANQPNRRTEVTAEEMVHLQAEGNELAEMQNILNALPMGLQVEALPDEAFDRLRTIARTPATVLCGDGLLQWNNLCRARSGLKLIN